MAPEAPSDLNCSVILCQSRRENTIAIYFEGISSGPNNIAGFGGLFLWFVCFYDF